jgi:hypothetical protein
VPGRGNFRLRVFDLVCDTSEVVLRNRSLCLGLSLCAVTSLLAGACAKASIEDRGRGDDDEDGGPLVKPELPDAGGRPERPDAGPERDSGPADGGTPDGGSECPTATVDLIKNGDFDEGPGVDWVEVSSGAFPLIVAEGDPTLPDEFVVTPASTPFMVYLGGYDEAADRIQQDIAVPPEATGLRLLGAFRIDTEETVESAFDNTFLEIVSTEDGAVLEELASVNNEDDTEDDFVVFDIPLAGDYAGQTVRFQLRTTTDATLDTDFFFDSLVLEATACAGDRE